jgi:glycerol-3-phosphate dehydrogenase
MRCAARCGAIVAEEIGYDPADGMRQALGFLHKQARTRVCALGPDQARQEALVIASVRSQMGITGRASLHAHERREALVSEAPESESPVVASSRPPGAVTTARTEEKVGS